MTAQRQYILPNCNLVIEGLVAGEESDPGSPLTVVLNSEFSFPGTPDRLSGGREFLDALVKTVSNYVQSLLSGVPHPLAAAPAVAQLVTLTPTHQHRHQLSAMVADASGVETRKAIDLNSVQLFDLMEAIDQLLADTLTLPDLSLQVASINRRHARPAEPTSKRVIPAAVGVSTLLAAAVMLFMLPVPEFEPQRRDSEQLSELTETESANLDNDAAAPPSDEAADSRASAGEADSESTDDEVPLNPSDTDGDTETEVVDPVTAGIALGRLSAAPTITNDRTLNDLEAELESKLKSALEDIAEDGEVTFSEDLIYRIAVSEDGDILGYKYENDAALENIDITPLPQLTFISVEEDNSLDEPVAQFRLTFEPDGTVMAEPITSEDE